MRMQCFDSDFVGQTVISEVTQCGGSALAVIPMRQTVISEVTRCGGSALAVISWIRSVWSGRYYECVVGLLL